MASGSVLQTRPRLMKVFLLLTSLFYSVVLFILLDWLANTILRHRGASTSAVKPASCIVLDPVRHHALKPNCSFVQGWGRSSYQVLTNNLGFRDREIRDVSLAGARPRLVMLGDSFTQGMIDWPQSFVGLIATHFPQYEVLNGGVQSYSPSNYLNVTRQLLSKGVAFDEVMVLIDISDANDEAAYYRDIDASGAAGGPPAVQAKRSALLSLRLGIRNHLPLTNHILELFEKNLIKRGYYHLITGEQYGDIFDMERGAWTYRKVSDIDPYPNGYAPLGLQGGIAKEKAKMTLLWQELQRRGISLSVVVYPWPAQVVHDTADSKQVRIWSDWCQGKCKRFISAFPDFFQAKKLCSSLAPGCWYSVYFVFGDVHYSAAGYSLLAGEVIKSLEASPVTKLPSLGNKPNSPSSD